jgi:hypothetical protein
VRRSGPPLSPLPRWPTRQASPLHPITVGNLPNARLSRIPPAELATSHPRYQLLPQLMPCTSTAFGAIPSTPVCQRSLPNPWCPPRATAGCSKTAGTARPSTHSHTCPTHMRLLRSLQHSPPGTAPPAVVRAHPIGRLAGVKCILTGHPHPDKLVSIRALYLTSPMPSPTRRHLNCLLAALHQSLASPGWQRQRTSLSRHIAPPVGMTPLRRRHLLK